MVSFKKCVPGATLWTVDLDDFNNMCCLGVNPLQNAASKVLRGYSNSKPGDCARPPTVSTPPPIALETTPWDDGGEWRPKPTAPPPSEWRPGYPDKDEQEEETAAEKPQSKPYC